VIGANHGAQNSEAKTERNTPPHYVQRFVEDIDLTALLLLVAGA
jgi:hypothetical protein